jgi:Domain of unknown function (DUF4390)
MTTTAFISHFWKRARLDIANVVMAIGLLTFGATAALAAGPEATAPEVAQLQVDRTAEGLFVTAAVKFELPAVVEDALLKGIPLVFVAEVDVFRNRWYWYDKKLVSAERHFRLAFQPLTRRWRLNIASGQISPNALGLALNQSFDSLPEAMAAVRRISRWKVAEASELEADQKQSLEFRYRLDVSQLPRPFQIGVLGQAEWSIALSSIQRLPTEISK